jgi:signal transduction histidine kinase
MSDNGNSTADDRAERILVRLEALNAVAQDLHGETDPDKVFAVIARELERLDMRISVLRLDEQRRMRVTFTSVAGPVQKQIGVLLGRKFEDLTAPLDTFPAFAEADATQRPVFVPQLEELTRDWLGPEQQALDEPLVGLLGPRSMVIAPLVVNGRVTHFMTISGDVWLGDQPLVTAFAHLATAALEHALILQSERERAAELDQLYAVSAMLSSELSLDAVLERVINDLVGALLVDSSTVLRWDRERDVVVTLRDYDRRPELMASPGDVYSIHPSLRRALETQQPVQYHRSSATLADGDRRELLHWDWQSVLEIPFVVRDRVIGLVELGMRRKEHVFTPGEIRLAQNMANQAALAIERAQLYAEAHQRLRRLESLRQIGLQLARSHDRSAVLETIVVGVEHALRADVVQLYLCAGDGFVSGGGWTRRAAAGAEAYLPGPDSLTARVAEVGGRLVLDAATGTPPVLMPEMEAWNVSALAGLPLQVAGRVAGVLDVGFYESRILTQEELEFLELLADQAAVAIESAQRAEGLEARVAERTAEIRREKERTEAILRSVADAVVVLDLQGDVALTNPMADLLLNGGWGSDPGLQPAVRDLVQTLATTTEPATSQLLVRPGLALEAHAARVMADDAIMGTVVVLHDITRLQELDRLKSQFVSTVSHELRTPLSNIKLYLTLLQKGRVEKRGDYYSVMEREVGRLEHLINELLDLSRLEAAVQPAHVERIVLDELIGTVLPNHRPHAEAKRLDVRHVPGAGVPAVRADRNQLIQVLTNLIANAILYTPEEGRIVLSTAAVTVDNRLYARVSVRDSGIGIPPEDRERIFERFYRSPRAEAAGVPGSGLGLAIVREIVGLHGGRVQVESTPGQGSDFVVLLPAESQPSGGET